MNKIYVFFIAIVSGQTFANDTGKTLEGIFSSKMPINNFCTDDKSKEKFEKITGLNLSLKHTVGVTSKQIVELICKNSKAVKIESISPSDSDNDSDDKIDKFVFNLKQSSGCAFQAVIYNDKKDGTVLNINEKKACNNETKKQKKKTQQNIFVGHGSDNKERYIQWSGFDLAIANASFIDGGKKVSKFATQCLDDSGWYKAKMLEYKDTHGVDIYKLKFHWYMDSSILYVDIDDGVMSCRKG